jgi:hypothetical protein
MRTPLHLTSALQENHADILGIGRMAVLCPDLPLILAEYAQTQGDQAIGQASTFFADVPKLRLSRTWSRILPKIKLVGAGAEVAWYVVAMRSLARNGVISRRMGPVEAVLRMWVWTSPPVRTDRPGNYRSRYWVHSCWVIIAALIMKIVLGFARVIF